MVKETTTRKETFLLLRKGDNLYVARKTECQLKQQPFCDSFLVEAQPVVFGCTTATPDSGCQTG